jgi:hypothetical protein
MMLEVALPAAVQAEEVERRLDAVRRTQQVDLTIRPLEQDAL